MKVKSNKSKYNNLLLYGLLLTVAILLLTGCSGAAEPKDEVWPAQDFSIELETHEDKIRADLIVSNPGDSEFPGDRDFKGKMGLWNAAGKSEGWAEVEILSSLEPGESTLMASLSWDLDPGVYFITWGEPNYGGVVSIFFVADNLSGSPEVIREHTFQTKPAEYGSNISNCGEVKSFSLSEDGSLIADGETGLPDQGCVFPLLFSWKGLAEGIPYGNCVEIEDGHWQMELPAPLDDGGFQLEEDEDYRLIVFSQDLSIPPSDPFEILISPPVQE